MEANEYLNQVVQEQARVEGELRKRRSPAAMVAECMRQPDSRDWGPGAAPTAGQAVEYRVTGWWFKTVVVPPSVYVVHTRRGQPEPLHLGLGLSFRYNPYTDAFLVIPAAVQTLLVNARCISAERQGVLVQAYVQWVVDDLRTAYRRLDFSDPSDPMRIVNVQLREQAEAAIKDKVATMPIDEILADRQPIIEELTTRLRGVAESSGDGAGGLGLKIVTVQIKEAVVSSTRLWENLQKPYRADREKLARLAELQSAQEIAASQLAIRQAAETAERRDPAEREAERARRLADEELALQQHELEAKRAARELEAIDRLLGLEKARAEMEKAKAAAAIERDDLEHRARAGREERDVELLGKRRAVENELSEPHVRSQLIARLPEIARELPKPDELRAVTVNGDGPAALTGLLAELIRVVDGALPRRSSNGQ